MEDTKSITNGSLLLLDTGVKLEAETKTPAPEPGSAIPDGDVDGEGNQDAASVRTTTDALFGNSDRGSEPAVGSKEHKLGLDINYPWGWSGSFYDDYDVITVHGIRDDYKSCWIDAEGGWWVKDRLFKNLSVREVDYSYEIDEDSSVYEPEGLASHAKSLINEYAKVRSKLEETETDRPIIWICHDLGGIIVKEALSLALSDIVQYGKISILTTAIIFVGTPHRFHSTDDLEDQILKLIRLPGPAIKDMALIKVRNIARQISRINQDFVATKLLDRAFIFNVFTQNKQESLKQISAKNDENDDDESQSSDQSSVEDAPNCVTPFSRYSLSVGQSFEAAGRRRTKPVDHLELIRAGSDEVWLTDISEILNTNGCFIKVDYNLIHFQARLLSLAPPTRPLDVSFDPLLPIPPIVRWINEQKPFEDFMKSGVGPRLIHLHGNGSQKVDITNVSRQFYVDYDATVVVSGTSVLPYNATLYFEFDQRDSRYSTLSSMLTYLINSIAWHFWEVCDKTITEELTFLKDMHSWSLEDLYQLYTTLRDGTQAAQDLTIFISCFDQCPKEQRKWFLEQILESQSYSEARYRLILSTASIDGLAVESFPDEARINIADCPAIEKQHENLRTDIHSELNGLLKRRSVYEDFRGQLEGLLNEYDNKDYLGQLILSWLGKQHRGKPKSVIAQSIHKLSPPTVENILQLIISSLPPANRQRANMIFNWVKHAAEPWSPEALAEALAMNECGDAEPSFKDIDVGGMIHEIEGDLGGIITIKDRDIKFVHPSFYDAPEIGIEGDIEERAFKVNSSIAETCLRYFQLQGGQENLAELSPKNLEGGPWATLVDAIIISHTRFTMAEYAVRFWPHHYKASGELRPSNLVRELFADEEARSSWMVPFWLLSNPFTRIQQSYLSTLPVYAMLGLEDMVAEMITSRNDQPAFEKDCWLAITEAARAGHGNIVNKLLLEVAVNETELPNALSWAASRGNPSIVSALIDKISNLETFQWPEGILFRAAAAGLDDLLSAMLLSGCNINETSNYWGAPPAVIVVWKNRVSTMEFLLNSEPKPDLLVKDADDDTPITTAAQKGNPKMIQLLLQNGASAKTTIDMERGPVQIAVQWRKHKAIDLLIKAGADFDIGETGDSPAFYFRPPLIIAGDDGLTECARVLLSHGANPNVACETGTALYKAVLEEHVSVTRLLLEHKVKPDMDVIPVGQYKLLMRAVIDGIPGIVTMLIEHGAKIDDIDENAGLCKTPLSRACFEGNLDIVKLLLSKGADINYTGGASDAPLFTALYEDQFDVAKYLLEDEKVDVHWTANDGMGSLHGGYNCPEILSKLLKRGAPIDGNSIYGTVLHMAAKYNFPKSIETLLQNDPKPDLELLMGGNAVSEVGYTPLQLACKSLAEAPLAVLLKAGADPKFKNKNGEDAVDILLRADGDTDAVEACLKLLLSKPPSVVVDEINDQGQTRLHLIQENTPISVVKLLLEANVPLDSQDQDGYTPLAFAISRGNEDAARYLIERGAKVNTFGPGFGSILHLAVSKGALELAKLLVESGANLETVDPEYGESVLYTALGISEDTKLKKMVRYLVDEARVPVNKLGGELGYPIIRAAKMAGNTNSVGTIILKFLIRRKAQLDVSDSQGRRAVHVACKSWYDDGIEALVEAGADVHVKDDFGRMPIHFAASSTYEDCLVYLMNRFTGIEIDVADRDGWTPLMWAARSGDGDSLTKLIDRGADVWVRGRAYPSNTEWSALKLMNFTDRNPWVREKLEPLERKRVAAGGHEEEWNDFIHKSRVGDAKIAQCESCFVNIVGIQWKCIECTNDYSLCFKCYGHRVDMHDSDHSFEEIGPLYYERPPSTAHTSTSEDGITREATQEMPEDENKDKKGNSDHGDATSEDGKKESVPSRADTPPDADDDVEFDPDNFDPDEED